MSGRWTGRLATAATVLAAGCGEPETPPVAAACTDGPQTIARALRSAPGTVVLPGGTRLSACVRSARTDAELQNVGITFSRAAEDLEDRALARPRAALELGFLIGATRRGAARGSGIQDELVRRIERSGVLEGASRGVVAALNEGIAAGEARG